MWLRKHMLISLLPYWEFLTLGRGNTLEWDLCRHGTRTPNSGNTHNRACPRRAKSAWRQGRQLRDQTAIPGYHTPIENPSFWRVPRQRPALPTPICQRILFQHIDHLVFISSKRPTSDQSTVLPLQRLGPCGFQVSLSKSKVAYNRVSSSD